jgi:hypothetical protein
VQIAHLQDVRQEGKVVAIVPGSAVTARLRNAFVPRLSHLIAGLLVASPCGLLARFRAEARAAALLALPHGRLDLAAIEAACLVLHRFACYRNHGCAHVSLTMPSEELLNRTTRGL